jgi:hypothetical protein
MFASPSLLGKGIEMANNIRERVSKVIANNYYIKDRAILHGLPIAIISAVALGYLFGTAGILVSAAYGIVNYSIITFLIEFYGPDKSINKSHLAAGAIVGIGYAGTTFFVQTVLKAAISFQAAIPLAIGAFAGSFARTWIWENEPCLIS